MQRRGFLAASVGVVGGLSGCLSGQRPSERPPEERGGDGTTDGPDSSSLRGHPAARGLDRRPHLGPPPLEADAVVVAFEDPSCPTCRRFEENAGSRIRSELVAAGRASFVHRHYPIVYEWGKPAVQALEATFVRDADAFWQLRRQYYEAQRSFTVDNVLALTREFLASETAVDAEAVVADARDRVHDEAVRADLDAGDAASVRVTPTTVLFRDGRFVTSVTGSKSFAVYREALGL
jgi:protein-disulfide isomerase